MRPDLDGALEVRLTPASAREDKLRPSIALIGLGHDAFGSAPAAASSRTRVFIHHTAAHPRDAVVAVRLADFLRRRGFEVGAIRPVRTSIRQASLRYFFERDRDDSRRLLEELGWFFQSEPQRAPDRASDFTHYRPLPRPGNIEVWLPTS